MGGGAHRTRDGEHAAAPFFATLADWGEIEDRETEIPVLGLWRRIPPDNHGFGMQRGGASVEWSFMLYGSQLFAFAVTSVGWPLPGHRRPLRRLRRPLHAADDDPPRGRRRAAVREWLGCGRRRPDLRRRPSMVADAAAGRRIRRHRAVHARRAGRRGRYLDPAHGRRRRLRRPARARPGGGDGRPAPATDQRGGRAQRLPRRVGRGAARARPRRRPSVPAPPSAPHVCERGRPYDEFVAGWRRDEPPEGVPYLGSWEWADREPKPEPELAACARPSGGGGDAWRRRPHRR